MTWGPARFAGRFFMDELAQEIGYTVIRQEK